MKPTFLYALLGGYSWLPVLFGLAFFVTGTLTITRGAGETTSIEGGAFLAGIGAVMLTVMVVYAYRRSRA